MVCHFLPINLAKIKITTIPPVQEDVKTQLPLYTL